MKEKKNNANKGFPLLLSIILVFCILGTVVFSVARKISAEMSSSAIHNLNESLSLVRGTIEAILTKEAEFQRLIAQEVSRAADPESLIRSYNQNHSMVKISLIPYGQTKGISNTGESFSEEKLDFSSGKTIDGLPISKSYLNNLGTWAYTIKCPVMKKDRETASLYIEYIYDSFDKALPGGFYNGKAML